MDEIKLIIEQYKKRLQTLKNTKGLDMIADTRLRTKASCYRTIVSELERALGKNTPTTQEQLAATAVSKSVCSFPVPCNHDWDSEFCKTRCSFRKEQTVC